MGRDRGSEEGEAGVAVLLSSSSIFPDHHHHGLHHGKHHHSRAEGKEKEREDSSSNRSSIGGDDDGQHDGHKKRSRSWSRSRSRSPRATGKTAAGSPSKPRVAPAADGAAVPAAATAAAAWPAIKKTKPSAAPLSFGDELEEEEAGVTHVKRSMDEVTTARLGQEQREQLKAAKTPAALMDLATLSIPRGPRGPQAPLRPPQQGAKSLQILDDEPDVVGRDEESRGGALPPPVCVMQAAHSRGPKAAMEDRHTIIAALGSGATLVEEPTPVAFVGVYDGHCGALAAEVAAAELHRFLEPHRSMLCGAAEAETVEGRVGRATAAMKEAYLKTEAMLLARLRREGNRQDGAAAVTAVVAGRHLYVANVGDCRAVLGTQTDAHGIRATRLSVDHKPNLPSEKQRVLRAGGSVEHSGVWRVAHQAIPMRLAVSRALGDPAFKRRSDHKTQRFSAGRAWLVGQDGSMTTRRGGAADGKEEEDEEDESEGEGGGASEQLVSPVPFVHCRELGSDDLVVVLASDGVWDAIMDTEAVAMAVEAIRRHPSHPPNSRPFARGVFHPTEMAVKEAADVLVNTALARGSYDNCTAAVVALHQPSSWAGAVVAAALPPQQQW